MDTPAREAGPRKLDPNVDGVPRATADIKVNRVAAIDEVRRHQGRFDQLDHRMSAYDWVFPEPDNEGVPRPPDTQEVAAFARKQLYHSRVRTMLGSQPTMSMHVERPQACAC